LTFINKSMSNVFEHYSFLVYTIDNYWLLTVTHIYHVLFTVLCHLWMILLKMVTICMFNSNYKIWKIFNCFFYLIIGSAFQSCIRIFALEFLVVNNSDTWILRWSHSIVLSPSFQITEILLLLYFTPF
jgi:hypothetical protein